MPIGAGSAQRGCLALIAIKRRVQCKSRLAGVLDLGERLTLVRHMLAHVLEQCGQATLVDHVVVLSPERDEVPADITVLADNGDSLNDALGQAHASLAQLGVREWLVLPADLPGVTAANIDAVIAAGRAQGCALAGDTAGRGTNALYVQLHRAFNYSFGVDSLTAHRREAARAGLHAQVLQLPGLELDVDTPADLFSLDKRTWQQHSA